MTGSRVIGQAPNCPSRRPSRKGWPSFIWDFAEVYKWERGCSIGGNLSRSNAREEVRGTKVAERREENRSDDGITGAGIVSGNDRFLPSKTVKKRTFFLKHSNYLIYYAN